MDDSILKHAATPDQLQHFDEHGYLIIEDALPPEVVGRLEQIVDRIDAEERERQGLATHELMARFNVVIEDDHFLELLDWPKTFPIVWDILGWNIQLYISHLIMYPPEPPDKEPETYGRHWHQDGGRPVPEMERPHPRLSLKIAYWLSDTTIPNCGAFRIIPGSHRWDALPEERDENGDPAGTTEVAVKPGTAVLFDRRLFHSRSYNSSNVTRKVVFFGYSYRWLRGLDYNNQPEEVLSKCDPIRRQILGDGVDIKGWWQPTEKDVPLRTWLREHRCAAADR
ncbi:MAG: phytanoyl-CoA dioxygenase family protein [Planctomycetota bacterium]|jgi:ectoine hydroxylase-related dioxygenase (phytanoyl-CoA dioxygenase family)|nr:phytanoyl-CoA dioxygenase family protein [Planctomycetota bacterium]MDP7249599.1 phytanoyl-CoA dioxygenase family protein [Planctomycetota bacterium]